MKKAFSTKTEKFYLFESIESSVLVWLVVLVQFIKEREWSFIKFAWQKPPEFLLYQPNENQNDKFHKNAHLL